MMVPSRSRKAARRVTRASRERRGHGPHELVIEGFGNAANVHQHTALADATDHRVVAETQPSFDFIRLTVESDGERGDPGGRKGPAANARLGLGDLACDTDSVQTLADLLGSRAYERNGSGQHRQRRN